MSELSLLMGILPLIIFAIVDSFAGLKTALVAAVVFAVFELIYSLSVFGEIDSITMLSFLLVGVLSWLAFRKQNEYYFKIQPVIMSLFLSAILLGSYLMGSPILKTFAMKYGTSFPEPMRSNLALPHIQRLLDLSTLTMGIGLCIHAAVTYWAAVKLSTWWWLIARGVGFYGIAFLAYLVAAISL